MAAKADPDRLARVQELLRAGVTDAAIPGGVVCVLHRGEYVLHDAAGTRDGAQPATLDTVYDLASLTKPVATASAVVSLVESGDLLLGDTLRDVFGLSAPDALAAVTVHDLLCHTSGLPAWTACYDHGPGLAAAVDAVLALTPRAEPATRHYEYSCLNFILLARIVLEVTGEPLDRLAQQRIFDRLGLRSLTFRPAPEQRALLAPTLSHEGPGAGTVLSGVPHDGNARSIAAPGDVSGNAGLFGTAADVAAFGEAVRTGRLFGGPATERALVNQLPPAVGGHTFLFYCQPNPLNPVGELLGDTAVGHSGFTGTVLVIDPRRELTIVVLTNCVLLEGAKPKWLKLRRRLMNVIAAALTEEGGV